MLTPYDLGENILVAENCFKINVDDLVRKVQQGLKIRLLEAQIEVLGVAVTFTTSKTHFNGERMWFLCPTCNKRVGTLYKHPLGALIGCRSCLNLKYKQQKFKGMVESLI